MPRLFDVVVSVGVIGAIVFAGLAFQASNNKTTTEAPLIAAGTVHGLGSAAGDSPVRVLGGSIMARSTAQWATVSANIFSTPAAAAPYSQIYLEGVALPGTPAVNQPVGWFNITVPWEIDVYSRDQNGADQSSTTDGVRVCSSYTTGGVCTRTGAPTTTLTIMPLGSNSLIVQAPDDGADYGKRFKHATCAGTNPQCEYIGHIVVTLYNSALGSGAQDVSFNYKCPAGECSIGFKPR